MLCSYQIQVSSANEAANGTKPAISVIRSAYDFGTSSDTTSSVSANAKTASLNASSREIRAGAREA